MNNNNNNNNNNNLMQRKGLANPKDYLGSDEKNAEQEKKV